MNIQFIRFSLVGTFAFFVDYFVVFFFVYFFGLSPFVSRIFSFIAAAIVTWLLNAMYTFKVAKSYYSLFQLSMYIFSMFFGLCLNYFTYSMILLSLGRSNSFFLLIAVAGGSLSGLFCNYFVSKKFCFKK